MVTGSSASVLLLWLLAAGLLILGLVPGPVLRCLVMLYPAEDARRAELLAELHAVPSAYRPYWVIAQIETALLDGLPARLRSRRSRRSLRREMRSAAYDPYAVPMAKVVMVSLAVVFIYWFTGGLVLVILLIPVLMLPALPLILLAALAVQHRRRVRGTRSASGGRIAGEPQP